MEYASCVELGGSFFCVCDDGYEGSDCGDIDECAMDNGGCDVLMSCSNFLGGFLCGDCSEGYAGDGLSGCSNINECADVFC